MLARLRGTDGPWDVQVVRERDVDRFDVGSAMISSYEPYERGISSCAAASRAFVRLREAIATTRESGLPCMEGTTFLIAMFAAPRIPQRTGSGIGAGSMVKR